jgi:ORF6N domain
LPPSRRIKSADGQRARLCAGIRRGEHPTSNIKNLRSEPSSGRPATARQATLNFSWHWGPIEQIDEMIRTIRGVRVMLDRDLAKIYGVPTKAFNQAVKRNRQRFPEDFMFRLTQEEAKALQASRSQTVTSSRPTDPLRSQSVTSNQRGGPRYLPYAFTEYGALMAANILSSARAVQMSILLFGPLRADRSIGCA